jgi:virginiamycin B lyase
MRKGSLLLLAVAVAFIGTTLSLSVEVEGQRGPQVQLPEGPGKELVSTACTKCHALNLITNSFGFSRDEWVDLFGSMVELPAADRNAVADYLSRNFPEKPGIPRAKIIPGPVTVNIREWQAPTLGSRPHDPLWTRDGHLWWTGQYASRLGRVDPKTGATKEYVLDTPNSGPHGLVEDAQGNIWYTGINVQEVGKVDPRTGAVTEYKLNLEGARGPHTPMFDKKGILFFTLQSGHVGRLNPATAEMKIVPSPSAAGGAPSYPYGIRVDSNNLLWYVDYRQPKLASVNADTMEIKEYTLPRADARPRRIGITADNAVWYTDFPKGYIGRFDPKTGQFKEWMSPGGEMSRPYGMDTVGDIVWYSESGVKPNTLVRFDPKTERFQTWAIPSRGHVVRFIDATPEGNIVMANSGINRVALAEVREQAGTR